MDNNEGNKKVVKSKIEQIRIDLEKKLAALESSKSVDNVEEVKSNTTDDITKDEIKVEIEDIVESTTVKVESIIDDNSVEPSPAFEIFEPIEKVVEENVAVEEVEAIQPSMIEETIPVVTEIPTKPIQIVEEIVEPVAEDVIIKDSLVSPVHVEDNFEDEDEVYETEEEEKSKKGFLIYGLLIALLSLIGYFSLGLFKDSNSLEKDKMNRIISQYKNKSYLDSIELADANNQLFDMQNQRIIDSMAGDYQIELAKKSNVNLLKNNARKKSSISNSAKDLVNETSILGGSVNKNLNSKGVKSVNVIDVPDKVDTSDKTLASKTSGVKTTKDSDTGEKVGLDTASEKPKSSLTTDDIVAKNDKEEKPNTDNVDKKVEEVAKKAAVIRSPIYPGCEKKKTPDARKKCSTIKMYKHVQNRFNTDIGQDLGLSAGLYKVRVFFVVDKNGEATVTKVRTNDKKLENEAIRVVQTLPMMIPGTSDGIKIATPYSVPINFMVGE